jgi:hypothetical protein
MSLTRPATAGRPAAVASRASSSPTARRTPRIATRSSAVVRARTLVTAVSNRFALGRGGHSAFQRETVPFIHQGAAVRAPATRLSPRASARWPHWAGQRFRVIALDMTRVRVGRLQRLPAFPSSNSSRTEIRVCVGPGVTGGSDSDQHFGRRPFRATRASPAAGPGNFRRRRCCRSGVSKHRSTKLHHLANRRPSDHVSFRSTLMRRQGAPPVPAFVSSRSGPGERGPLAVAKKSPMIGSTLPPAVFRRRVGAGQPARSHKFRTAVEHAPQHQAARPHVSRPDERGNGNQEPARRRFGCSDLHVISRRRRCRAAPRRNRGPTAVVNARASRASRGLAIGVVCRTSIETPAKARKRLDGDGCVGGTQAGVG